MDKLIGCVIEALDAGDESLSDSFDYTQHANWDSMAQLGLIVKIEEEFGKVVDGGVFKNHPTIKSLKDYLAS